MSCAKVVWKALLACYPIERIILYINAISSESNLSTLARSGEKKQNAEYSSWHWSTSVSEKKSSVLCGKVNRTVPYIMEGPFGSISNYFNEIVPLLIAQLWKLQCIDHIDTKLKGLQFTQSFVLLGILDQKDSRASIRVHCSPPTPTFFSSPTPSQMFKQPSNLASYSTQPIKTNIEPWNNYNKTLNKSSKM